MATSFNLQEYILFRTEIKRELTNAEVDTNFKMVSNPWESTRIYEIEENRGFPKLYKKSKNLKKGKNHSYSN